MSAPTHDLIVFGATSFVGRLLTRYLFERFGTRGDLAWAVAGRSETRLAELRQALGPKASRLRLLVADAADTTALERLCSETRAVVSTVGPYALYGEPLVRACSHSGTDYCDLAGEAQWIRRMLDRYEATARKSGARLVHACGFDSIPSDLGVYFLQREARKRFGEPCVQVRMRVEALRGTLSGGTIASMMNLVRETAADPQLRKELANPYSLCPASHTRGARQPNVTFAQFDPDFDSWVAPFVMSAINTRIVHRTNAISQNTYGRDFLYDEAMMTGRGVQGRLAALGLVAGLGSFMAAGAFTPTRWALERFVLPAPGEGPSPEAQKNGYFDLRFVGRTADGRELRTKVTGDRDPGYGSTAKMLGQAGACLALDLAKSREPGGFWTPASLLGGRLLARLTEHSGLAFEVIEDRSAA